MGVWQPWHTSSEADFQHPFAWLLRGESVLHLDPLASSGNKRFAVELKYRTMAVTVMGNDKDFELTNQAAQDLGWYDFIKDIRRLERLTSDHRHMSGYVMLLTNDSSYWA